MNNENYVYDELSTRYELIKTNSGPSVNWLFIPGGPGGDSVYFHSLVNELNVPGKIWLVDFPANGSNISESINADYNFNLWEDCFRNMVSRFDHPIIVGHSFGGMFPLLFPELEDILSGFIILNASPCLWQQEQELYAKRHGIPLLREPMNEFIANPNQDTFKTALLACAPYYFPERTLKQGKEMLGKVPFNYHAAVWGQRMLMEIKFYAQWIPQHVPTLVIGASHDFIVPFTLFEKDNRFKRDNIQLQKINDAGHMPWMEQPAMVKTLIEGFEFRLYQK